MSQFIRTPRSVDKNCPQNRRAGEHLKRGCPETVQNFFLKPVLELKEVLRRENQGLKVYPVDGSSVFSMTGTYF